MWTWIAIGVAYAAVSLGAGAAMHLNAVDEHRIGRDLDKLRAAMRMGLSRRDIPEPPAVDARPVPSRAISVVAGFLWPVVLVMRLGAMVVGR